MFLIPRWSYRLFLLLLVCLLGSPSKAQVLRVHPDHSRLLEFRGEPVILKTLAEHYGSVINPDFNYIPYLNTLQANGMNLTRVVLVGFHANSGDFNDTLNPSLDRYLQPWPRRTTSGLALDGRGKWDLSTWNEAYFTRLRAFVQACSDRGIIVELTLFNTYYFANQWELSPFNPLNNMQGYGPNTGVNSRYDSMRPLDANLYAAQQAVVRRIVRDMNPYDNVYFEIQNEPFWNQPGIQDAAETTFHNTMLAAIRNEESTLPNRHLVAHNFPQRIATLTDDFDIINCHYPFAVPSTTIIGGENLLRDFYTRNRPLSMDETNMAGPIEARLESWMFLMGGGTIYNGLDQGSNVYSISDPVGNSAPAPAIRAGLRNLAGYINALDILAVRRDLSWVVSGTAANAKFQAMSKPGQQYAAYFYHGSFSAPFQVVYAPIDASNHTTNLRVNLPAGSYRAVWTRPSDMFTLRVETFTHAGGQYVMQPVTYQEDVALRIDRTGAGDTTAPPPPADLVASINSQGNIQLSWPAVPAADLVNYRIYRFSGSGTPTFVGSPLATTASNVISYTDSTAAGGMEHRYVVKAVDNQGNESRRSKIALAVAPINFDPPSANAGTDQYLTDSDRNLSHAVVLNGAASVAGDRPIVSHIWRVGGQQVASGANPTANLAAGIHDVELTVTDDVGLSSTDIVRIFISNPDFNNGSFENSLTAPFTPGGHSMLAEGLAGWTLQGETDALTLFAGHTATNGNTVLVFNGGGKPAGNGITQTFPTVPGKTYIVDFDMGVVAYNTTTLQRLSMQIRGNTLQPLQTFDQNGNISGGNNQNVVWTARTFSFVADSTITSLIVKDASPNVNALDLVLDHVRVRAQADRELTVSSLPTAGVSITVSPSDLNGAASGSTPFNRNFQDGSAVTLTAPPLSGNLGFQNWLVDGLNAGNANPLVINLTANRAVVAVYEAGPPVILSQPASVQAGVGDAVLFSVSAAGTGTLSYQWSFNGTPIPGAEAATLQIPSVTGQAAGTYEVEVSSSAGQVDSQPATLSVRLPDFPNGGFETGFAGWNVTGNAFLLGPYPGYAAAEGSQLIVFNGGNTAPNGVMSHNFATVPGVTYRVSYSAGTSSYKNFQQILRMEIQGTTLRGQRQDTLTGNSSQVAEWQSFSQTFVADSISTSITFMDLSPTTISIDLLLDNVVVAALTPVQFGGANPLLAQAQSPSGEEDVPLNIQLSSSGGGGGSRVYQVTTAPSNGILSGTPPNLTYTPNTNYNGTDVFAFTVSEGSVTSAPAQVSITVQPVNDPPVANSQSQSTDKNSPLAITLTGSDLDGDGLTFAVSGNPTNGVLSGVAPSLTYTPNTDFHGADSFTFTVSDGLADPVQATVSITVNQVNNPPVIVGHPASVLADAGDSIQFAVAAAGAGTLNYQWRFNGSPIGGATTAQLPITNVSGMAAGTYHVEVSSEGGQVSSQLATLAVKLPDFPNGGFEDGLVGWTVTGNAFLLGPYPGYAAAEGSQLIVLNGGNTTPNGVMTHVVETVPGASYRVSYSAGTVSFKNFQQILRMEIQGNTLRGQRQDTFVGNSSQVAVWQTFTQTFVADSTSTTIAFMDLSPRTDSIDLLLDNVVVAALSPVPFGIADPLVANPKSVSGPEDAALGIVLEGSGGTGGALDFNVVGNPAHGILSGTPPNLIYTPGANFHGSDSFTFTVSEGGETSPVAAVSIQVSPVNDLPTATAQALATDEDTALNITLAGIDVESPTLITEVLTQPSNGVLTGTPPALTYTPNLNFAGSDSFTFKVNDGTADSAAATITINVVPVNDQPQAIGQTLTIDKNTATAVTLAGTDVDNNSLSYQITVNPTHGDLSGTPPMLTYTPQAGYFGPDSLAFTVSDGAGPSLAATIDITVAAVGQPLPELSVARLADTCKITLTPHAAANYRIEWSDDLLIWENLEQRVISSAGEVEFIDPSPPPDRRFYRAVTNP